MRRLWLRLWLAVFAGIVLVTMLSFVVVRMFLDPAQWGPSPDTLAAEVVPALPAEGDRAALAQTLAAWHERSDADLALFDRERRLLARAGRPLPPPRPELQDSHWLGWRRHAREEPAAGPFGRAAAPIYAQRLADGRWLVVGRELRPRRGPFGLVTWLVLLALGVALGAYPIVRRLTRRLERLQRGVERLGRGELAARVAVEGRDEVAQLAASFNDAAARIEALVQSHRALLANASHELRSPLARVRLAVEMLAQQPRPDLKRELERDIAELDALIEEILLAGRLDAQGAAAQPLAREPVDLTALAAEEAARVGAAIDGVAVTVAGDARLLRRLLRNLLENARRHGGPAPVEVDVRAQSGQAVVRVLDRGPGVAAEERERIFEPFYRARGAAQADGGVGLGLALVERIARRHSGTVQCLPRDGGGAEFRVTLPLAGADR